MNFFENLVSEYTSGEPENYERIASQLREGTSSLQIRNQLMEEYGLSRLAAGKMVEDVERRIKTAKLNLASGGGIILFGVIVFLTNPALIASYAIIFFGVVQFVGGLRGWRSYQQANKDSSTGSKK